MSAASWELQAEHEEPPQVETELRERVHSLPPEGDEKEPHERDHRADEDDRRASRLDNPHQDVHDVCEVLLPEAVGQAQRLALPGPGLAESLGPRGESLVCLRRLSRLWLPGSCRRGPGGRRAWLGLGGSRDRVLKGCAFFGFGRHRVPLGALYDLNITQ
jgi:hypothetical protein